MLYGQDYNSLGEGGCSAEGALLVRKIQFSVPQLIYKFVATLSKALTFNELKNLLSEFLVPPSHMKVPPGHYNGSHTTSKGQAPLVYSGCLHYKNINKPMNLNSTIMVMWHH